MRAAIFALVVLCASAAQAGDFLGGFLLGRGLGGGFGFRQPVIVQQPLYLPQQQFFAPQYVPQQQFFAPQHFHQRSFRQRAVFVPQRSFRSFRGGCR